MPKRVSWRLVKRHRPYRVDEVSRLLSVSKGTVRRWVKTGLPIVGPEKPFLITGDDLIEFLKNRSKKGQKLKVDECWCFSCQSPRKPAYGEVTIEVSNQKSGMMHALCKNCTNLMFKRISQAQILELNAIVRVTINRQTNL